MSKRGTTVSDTVIAPADSSVLRNPKIKCKTVGRKSHGKRTICEIVEIESEQFTLIMIRSLRVV